jgi:hypothetical protein
MFLFFSFLLRMAHSSPSSPLRLFRFFFSFGPAPVRSFALLCSQPRRPHAPTPTQPDAILESNPGINLNLTRSSSSPAAHACTTPVTRSTSCPLLHHVYPCWAWTPSLREHPADGCVQHSKDILSNQRTENQVSYESVSNHEEIFDSVGDWTQDIATTPLGLFPL